MPERVYRDLGGGNSLPLDAFHGATAQGVRSILEKWQPEGADTSKLSWLELAGNVQPPELSERTVELLQRVGPELLALLQRQQPPAA